MKAQSCQLAGLSLDHVEFLAQLTKINALNEDQAVSLFMTTLTELPEETKQALMPFNRRTFQILATLRADKGRRRIAVYTDAEGRRHFAAAG